LRVDARDASETCRCCALFTDVNRNLDFLGHRNASRKCIDMCASMWDFEDSAVKLIIFWIEIRAFAQNADPALAKKGKFTRAAARSFTLEFSAISSII